MTRKIMWVGFCLRLLIAGWNGFLGPSFGAEGDAIDLHYMAVDFTNGVAPRIFRLNYLYAYLLAQVYNATVTALLVGSLLSCLAWLASARALIASMSVLSIGKASQAQAMLLFAFMPSSLLWTSVTLREPYQLLFVNLAIYAALKIGLARSPKHWILLLCAVLGGGILHAALFGWGVVLLLSTAAWVQSRNVRRVSPGQLVATVVSAGALLGFGYLLFTQAYSFPIDRGLAYAVESYQRGGLSIGARTDYRSAADIANTFELVFYFTPVALFQYLFEPMAWRLSALGDLGPFFESLLRAALIAQTLYAILSSPVGERSLTLFTFGSFLSLETAWALGTFNWGTAARHHIPGLGLLLLAAFSGSARRVPAAVANGQRSSLRAVPPVRAS